MRKFNKEPGKLKWITGDFYKAIRNGRKMNKSLFFVLSNLKTLNFSPSYSIHTFNTLVSFYIKCHFRRNLFRLYGHYNIDWFASFVKLAIIIQYKLHSKPLCTETLFGHYWICNDTQSLYYLWLITLTESDNLFAKLIVIKLEINWFDVFPIFF